MLGHECRGRGLLLERFGVLALVQLVQFAAVQQIDQIESRLVRHLAQDRAVDQIAVDRLLLLLLNLQTILSKS